MVISVLGVTAMSDIEILHGLSSSLAHILEVVSQNSLAANTVTQFVEDLGSAWRSLESLQLTIKGFSSRTVRSELPTAVAQLLAALCNTTLQLADSVTWEEIPWKAAETITEHVLSRSEDTILDMIPSMVEALFALKQKAGVLPGCLAPQVLDEQVNADVSKSTLHGAGRAVALGALVSSYMNAARDEAFAVVQTLSSLIHASNVERRVVGVRALTLVVESAADGLHTNASIFQLICQATHQGMNDYTIDERGDIGSLVRLQAIACAHGIITATPAESPHEAPALLRCDILRLSLEKLDRVRLLAARSADHLSAAGHQAIDVVSVSSVEYFRAVLAPLKTPDCGTAIEHALLEGCVSCAGVSAESLLQASRRALAEILDTVENSRLRTLMTTYSTILKSAVQFSSSNNTMHPALELFDFLLNLHIPQRLATEPSFKWRNVLSLVQKGHHKSNDLPRILAAVRVYHGLARVPAIRDEVLKKLVGMLKTNPYPRVRVAVAEVLWSVTGEEMLKGHNWAAKGDVDKTLGKLQAIYVP
nr:hypothetical protein CFP56_12022 [Quercus suber]